jgi:hypothetical protein
MAGRSTGAGKVRAGSFTICSASDLRLAAVPDPIPLGGSTRAAAGKLAAPPAAPLTRKVRHRGSWGESSGRRAPGDGPVSRRPFAAILVNAAGVAISDERAHA